MIIAVARTRKARNPSRTLDRVVGVDTQLPTKSFGMEKPYRTDQATCSTRAGSNGSDNEPVTKTFHGTAANSQAIPTIVVTHTSLRRQRFPQLYRDRDVRKMNWSRRVGYNTYRFD